MKQTGLTISQFAATAGVGVETVRYYQRKGLLKTPETDGRMRRYNDEAIRQLRFIRRAQEAGFTLSEIGELLRLDSGHDHERARELAKKRIDELDSRIAEMQRARDSLNKLAGECAKGGHSRPCAILSAFDV
jgi:MerR family mercuric resistance operon transcriptional regulator